MRIASRRQIADHGRGARETITVHRPECSRAPQNRVEIEELQPYMVDCRICRIDETPELAQAVPPWQRNLNRTR